MLINNITNKLVILLLLYKSSRCWKNTQTSLSKPSHHSLSSSSHLVNNNFLNAWWNCISIQFPVAHCVFIIELHQKTSMRFGLAFFFEKLTYALYWQIFQQHTKRYFYSSWTSGANKFPSLFLWNNSAPDLAIFAVDGGKDLSHSDLNCFKVHCCSIEPFDAITFWLFGINVPSLF